MQLSQSVKLAHSSRGIWRTYIGVESVYIINMEEHTCTCNSMKYKYLCSLQLLPLHLPAWPVLWQVPCWI